jgi:hypothetical protein
MLRRDGRPRPSLFGSVRYLGTDRGEQTPADCGRHPLSERGQGWTVLRMIRAAVSCVGVDVLIDPVVISDAHRGTGRCGHRPLRKVRRVYHGQTARRVVAPYGQVRLKIQERDAEGGVPYETLVQTLAPFRKGGADRSRRGFVPRPPRNLRPTPSIVNC